MMKRTMPRTRMPMAAGWSRSLTLKAEVSMVMPPVLTVEVRASKADCRAEVMSDRKDAFAKMAAPKTMKASPSS